MKRTFTGFAVFALLVMIIMTALATPALSQSVSVLKQGTMLLARNGTHADSMETDSTGWYRTSASAPAIYVQYQAYHPTANPLDTFAIQYRWKGSLMTLTRTMKALADSTETVHLYQINLDSLGRPDFRFLHISKRDSTDGYLQLLWP